MHDIAYYHVQGTVTLFIEVEDNDLFFDDHVDDVYATITQSPSSSFSSNTLVSMETAGLN